MEIDPATQASEKQHKISINEVACNEDFDAFAGRRGRLRVSREQQMVDGHAELQVWRRENPLQVRPSASLTDECLFRTDYVIEFEKK